VRGHQPLRNEAAQILAAEPKRQADREHETGEDDEKGPLHDVAADFDLAQGDHDDEEHDGVAHEPAQHVGVRDRASAQ